MSAKCSVNTCGRRAVLEGYCSPHYEKDIQPYAYLTRSHLYDFILSVHRILASEFGIGLPAAMLPPSADAWPKAALRDAYSDTKRYVDVRLRRKLLAAKHLSRWKDVYTSPDPLWRRWEKVCQAVAVLLYGEVLLRPRLPNGAMPDIVPRTPGLVTGSPGGSAPSVISAPLVIEVKQSLLHGEVPTKYGRYADKVEVWIYRWRPQWLAMKRHGVSYKSAIELSRRAEAAGSTGLASLLRSLPLLWRTYEVLPHFLVGLN